MFSLSNRGKLDRYVQDEFERLFARLRGLFAVAHNDDGTLRGLEPRLASLIPIATMAPYAGSSAPTGWLLCDGSQVSRVSYKSLFEVVGTTYGAGDGSTTFHIPDLRARFPFGKAAAGTGSALGATFGALDHVHTGPSHTHSISSQAAHQHSIGAHSHTIPSSGSTHSHTTGTPNGDSSTSISYQPGGTPAQFVNGPSNHTHDISGDGSHNHGGATDTTDLLTAEAGGHDHSGATGSAGTGNTGTANPPALAINFIIFAGA